MRRVPHILLRPALRPAIGLVAAAAGLVATTSGPAQAHSAVAAPHTAPGSGHLLGPVVRGTGATSGVWPLAPEPAVVQPFRPPASAYGPGHRGVDLAGGVGQQVRAALAGRVSFAGLVAGRGVVVVDHGAMRTTYEPVRASVAVGDDVVAGQPIGSLTWFGGHCAPSTCLHWGLVEGEAYRDPLILVGAGPVRLLPLRGWPGPVAGSQGIAPVTSGVAGQARGWA